MKWMQALLVTQFLAFPVVYYLFNMSNIHSLLNFWQNGTYNITTNDFPKTVYAVTDQVRSSLPPDKRPIILLWNYPTSRLKPTLETKCGECLITLDHRMESKSDIIVFLYKHLQHLPDPNKRKDRQLYLWVCRESPATIRSPLHQSLNIPPGYFNATMTYRLDSTIPFNYLDVIHYRHQDASSHFISFFHRDVATMMSSKRHTVLWMARDCHITTGASYRYNYIMNLVQLGLDVDIYGSCTPDRRMFPPFRSRAAFKKMSLYKFYLSFENSFHCRGYITEKFWDNGIYSGAIPIVWGPKREDLIRDVPPNSYIFVEDFGKDIKKLVDYINYVNENDTEYLKYFQWRLDLQEMDKILTTVGENGFLRKDARKRFKELTGKFPNYHILLKNRTLGYCDLCKAAITGRSKTFTPIQSLDSWWYDTENKECINFRKPARLRRI